VDLLVRVHDDDHDGQVIGKAQDAGGVETAAGAEAFDAADDGGTGQTGVVGPLHDLVVEGVTAILVLLAHVDGETGTLTLDLHGVDPFVREDSRTMATPATAAAIPVVTDRTTSPMASTTRPSLISNDASTDRVENVV